jgi:hypothetical protein
MPSVSQADIDINGDLLPHHQATTHMTSIQPASAKGAIHTAATFVCHSRANNAKFWRVHFFLGQSPPHRPWHLMPFDSRVLSSVYMSVAYIIVIIPTKK